MRKRQDYGKSMGHHRKMVVHWGFMMLLWDFHGILWDLPFGKPLQKNELERSTMFHGKTHVISIAILDQTKLHSSRAFQASALGPGALRGFQG